MFFDLCVQVPALPAPATQSRSVAQSSKKNKGKQPAAQTLAAQRTVGFSPTQIAKLESHIDLLVRLGYSILAFNQTVKSKVDPKSHVDVLDPLLKQLRKRHGVLFLKRLTIVLDEDSERGNGLTTGNSALFAPYDILALHPTTQNALSNACLTHTQPSPLTTHIISLPLTAPRLPFRLKHTLVRTAIKNGAVFEINYAGAFQGEDERRNWWASARELARVTKGKGLIVSGGVETDADLRAPRDVVNLITLLDLAQNLAHDASTTTPKSLLQRTQTRKTYRAILSEPTLIMSTSQTSSIAAGPEVSPSTPTVSGSHTRDHMRARDDENNLQAEAGIKESSATDTLVPSAATSAESSAPATTGTKRTFDSIEENEGAPGTISRNERVEGDAQTNWKRKKRGKAA